MSQLKIEKTTLSEKDLRKVIKDLCHLASENKDLDQSVKITKSGDKFLLEIGKEDKG